jgi:hypothetical protein
MKYAAWAFFTPIVVTTALVLFRDVAPSFVIAGFVFGGIFGAFAGFFLGRDE